MRTWLKANERRVYAAAFLLLGAFILLGLGRVELHNEIECDVYDDAFLGYVDDSLYSGDVIVTAEQMPEWCRNLGIAGEQEIEFADGISGNIGIFADVIYYENRYELRTWFSGKTLEKDSEYYYRIDGPIKLEAVYQPLECQIDVNNIRGTEYDYTAFKGK
jgi:hypothetical protein